MKNLYIKAIFQTLILLSLAVPYHIEGINFPWYQGYFHKLNGIHYAKHCSLIHNAQKIRGAALLAYYRFTHKKVNLNKAISLVQTKLKEFETWLITLEQDTLITIKEKYQISDDIWQRYLTDTQCIKNSYKDSMHHKQPNITHDPTVPVDILKMLTTLLESNNINPQSVHIKMVTDQTLINENKNSIMQVRTFITLAESKQFAIASSYIPACIEIFPNLITRTLSEKISFCAHEIQHLIQQHSLTELILKEYLEHYYGLSSETLDQATEFHTLAQIHEAQAEILSAINNPNTAHCHTMTRKEYLYPHHLYEEHFIHLSTIDMLWKINAWLEFFHQNGVIKKRNEWFVKIKEYGNSLKQLLS